MSIAEIVQKTAISKDDLEMIAEAYFQKNIQSTLNAIEHTFTLSTPSCKHCR